MDPSGFKKQQLQYERLAIANERLADSIKSLLSSKGVTDESFQLYLRAFKSDNDLELWIKVKSKYSLLKSYAICASSGNIGPKRNQGDMQVPEGFYHIDRFNPMSRFHLSLGINYPNRSDKILSDKKNPGGDIFIHGDCVTIGCLPIQNEPIEELYLFCVEAKDRGQQNIPVTIFPARMTESNFNVLQNSPSQTNKTKLLWSELRSAYISFNEHKILPSVRFLPDGGHRISDDL